MEDAFQGTLICPAHRNKTRGAQPRRSLRNGAEYALFIS